MVLDGRDEKLSIKSTPKNTVVDGQRSTSTRLRFSSCRCRPDWGYINVDCRRSTSTPLHFSRSTSTRLSFSTGWRQPDWAFLVVHGQRCRCCRCPFLLLFSSRTARQAFQIYWVIFYAYFMWCVQNQKSLKLLNLTQPWWLRGLRHWYLKFK